MQWGGANDRGQSIECSGVELMTVGPVYRVQWGGANDSGAVYRVQWGGANDSGAVYRVQWGGANDWGRWQSIELRAAELNLLITSRG